MTELSVMLISGTLGEGATVTVTANARLQKLDYKVTGMLAGNGKKRANEASTKNRGPTFANYGEDDIDAMED